MRYRIKEEELLSKEGNLSQIERLVRKIDAEDKYVLDDKNAIIVIRNPNKKSSYYYIMIHERLIDDELQEINRWNMESYHFGSIHDQSVIKQYSLFKVQGTNGNFNALYNYKKAQFVIPQREWQTLYFGKNDKYLKEYNGILGEFRIDSTPEKSDMISYISPLTNEKIVESFSVSDGNYYAIINLDGSIRKKKLFKGSSFSKIKKIIDLKEYGTLQEFKEERKRMCNEKKQNKKDAYYKMLEERNDGSISPYLDNEVIKVLQLKKKEK